MINLRHLLGIKDLNKNELLHLITNAEKLIEISEREIKKVPSLRGRTIINLFLEPSTRTRSSFELAGKRLSADVINISESSSSVKKGETLLDTAKTLESMSPDIIVIRHPASGSANFIAKHLKNTAVVNAGDGSNEHPTQALLDCLSLKIHLEKQKRSLEGLKIAIVGDIKHSRVARSNIWAHLLLGNKITLIGPKTLVPDELTQVNCFKTQGAVSYQSNLKAGIEGADVIICLRLQLERQNDNLIPSLEEYTNEYFVSEKLIKEVAPNAIVMHPGPLNRGVEVESSLIDGPMSLLNTQVKMGLAARMAVLLSLISSGGENN